MNTIRNIYYSSLCLLTGLTFLATPLVTAGEVASPVTGGQADGLVLIVMDPLAAPLSCPCVEGYAQRKYEVLQTYLSETTGSEIQLVFAESMAGALKKTGGRADLVIGKDSVVEADLKNEKISAKRLCRLSDPEGSTEQYGLIVVNRDDPAKQVSDLVDYKIIFGPTESAEKHDAALALLAEAGVSQPKELAIDEACSDGACKVIDLGPTSKTAAVISSYAKPLLEGCGTIKKGDLRVVGQTESVPFITVFVNEDLGDPKAKRLQDILLQASSNRQLLDALESLLGFVSLETAVVDAKKK